MKNFFAFFKEHPHLVFFLAGVILVIIAISESVTSGQIDVMPVDSPPLRWCTFVIGLVLIIYGVSKSRTSAQPSSSFPDEAKYYKIISVFTKRALDIPEYSNFSKLTQWDFHGGDHQLFKIISCGNESYCIQNKWSLKYLDVPDNSRYINGAIIQQWERNNGQAHLSNQLWKIEPVGSYYRIISMFSDKSLDVSENNNGSKILQWEYHGGTNQLWEIKAV
jgi:hypothetical protein